jgi:hypothetical protein
MGDYADDLIYGSIEGGPFTIKRRKKHEKRNGEYSYKISILNEQTHKSVYETVSWGKNQKDAVLNFRKNEPEIRKKYLELGGYVLGVLRF